jgi:hypothetical protein
MMGFVIDDQDVLFRSQFFQHPATKSRPPFHASLYHTPRPAVVFRLKEMPVGDLKFPLL